MAINTSFDGASTLTDFIQGYNVESIRINLYYLQQIFSDDKMKRKILVNESGIYEKYLEELEANKETVVLSTEEYHKYRYNPKLLSYDIYGTTELWFLILAANEMYTITDFDTRSLYLYNTGILSKIDRIVDLDRIIIEQNAAEISAGLQS